MAPLCGGVHKNRDLTWIAQREDSLILDFVQKRCCFAGLVAPASRRQFLICVAPENCWRDAGATNHAGHAPCLGRFAESVVGYLPACTGIFRGISAIDFPIDSR